MLDIGDEIWPRLRRSHAAAYFAAALGTALP